MLIRPGDYVKIKSGTKSLGKEGIVLDAQPHCARRLIGILCQSCGGLDLRTSGVFGVVGQSAPTFCVLAKTLKAFQKCPDCEDPQGEWHTEEHLTVVHAREKIFGQCVEEWTDVALPNNTSIRVNRVKDTVLGRLEELFG
jgi:hypothetical protein